MAKKSKKSTSNKELEMALIQNFVNLQKVQTNLSIKIDSLSDQISKLLQLFEIAAKSFVQKQEEKGAGDKDLVNKLDVLLDQNRTIAKGLTLIEEKIRHKIETSSEIPGITQQNTDRFMHHPHTEQELHGIYPGHQNLRPTPGNRQYPAF